MHAFGRYQLKATDLFDGLRLGSAGTERLLDCVLRFT
jgi:hypothetical protein